MSSRVVVASAVVFALSLVGAATVMATQHRGGPMSREAQLGELLFSDERLSEPAGQSCASCHDASMAFTDPDANVPTSEGVLPGRFGARNTPTAMYAAFSPAFHFDAGEGLYVGGQFLDGRASTLEDQAKGPFLNPIEMANSSKQQVVDKVRRRPYAAVFMAVYGRDIFADTDRAYDAVARAIAAFERTESFAPFSSKYDEYLAGKARLTRREKLGLEVFEREDKGNCAACHMSAPGQDGQRPLFTDFTYDNLGVPRNPKNLFYQVGAAFNPDGVSFVDRGLGSAVGAEAEDGKFKVPTLRNIAETAPYMHNGYFRTLRGVVDFYNTRDVKPACPSTFVTEREALRRGCWPEAEVPANVNHDELGDLGLNDDEVDALVAFLETLTDERRGRR